MTSPITFCPISYLSSLLFLLSSQLPSCSCVCVCVRASHAASGAQAGATAQLSDTKLSSWVLVERRAPHPTHAAIAARLQLLPESLHVGQLQFVEGDGHLSDGVIPAEAVVIKDLQV